MPSSYNRPSSGDIASQLPAWIYTNGSLGDGRFTTNDTVISATTSLFLSNTVFGTNWSNPAVNSILILTDSIGQCILYTITNFGTIPDGQWLTVALLFSGPARGLSDNWSGKYTASFLPQAQSADQVGLGNVPNVDATNASNLASGTIPDARFPATLPAIGGGNLTGISATQVGADVSGAAAAAQAAAQSYADGLIAALLASPATLPTMLAACSIVPVSNGGKTISSSLGGTVTTDTGFVTNWAPAA